MKTSPSIFTWPGIGKLLLIGMLLGTASFGLQKLFAFLDGKAKGQR